MDAPEMKGLRAFLLRHLHFVAPTVMIGMLALTAVGAQFLDDRHAPTWLKWMIGVPYVALVCFVGMVLSGDGADD